MQISANFIHAGGHASKIFMRLSVTRVQFICDWPPVACNLHAKPAVFADTLREQLFELKNEDANKKSENLLDTFAY